jgi:hypothetical protein
MNEDQDLLQIIRQAMKSPNKTSKPLARINGKGVQKTKIKPLEVSPEYGKRGDFSRSNSNPVSRSVSNSAPVGFEEVTRARLDRKHGPNDRSSKNGKEDLNAEFETILKVVKIAIDGTGGAPSKRHVKQAASPKMTKSDRVFQSGKGCGVGSSRSVTLGIIKAIAAKDTGCLVREQMKDKKTKEPLKPLTLTESQKNANTTQGNYNPMIVERVQNPK